MRKCILEGKIGIIFVLFVIIVGFFVLTPSFVFFFAYFLK